MNSTTNTNVSIESLEKKVAMLEEALRQSNDNFQAIFESAPFPIAVTDIDDSSIIFANTAAIRKYGAKTTEDVNGRKSSELYIDPLVRGTIIDRIKTHGFIDNFEIEMRDLHDNRFWVIFSARIIVFNGKSCLISSQYDITERILAERALRKALDEVKQLSGLIPICSRCKKIRNDSGFWQQVEVYLAKRTDAQFSHGVCPDCIRVLYPQVADKIIDKLHKKDLAEKKNSE